MFILIKDLTEFGQKIDDVIIDEINIEFAYLFRKCLEKFDYSGVVLVVIFVP